LQSSGKSIAVVPVCNATIVLTPDVLATVLLRASLYRAFTASRYSDVELVLS
jgi:hypothetical protein